MEITFLGGADEIGASSYLLEAGGKKLLIDALPASTVPMERKDRLMMLRGTETPHAIWPTMSP